MARTRFYASPVLSHLKAVDTLIGERRVRWPVALVLLLSAAPALAAPDLVTVPDDGTFVIDQANVVDSATEQKLERWLLELEQKTTAQVKLLTVVTTWDEDVFSFTQRHFDTWKLGRKGKDNGVLIVLAVKERQVQIHTGYGIQSVLPDSWIGQSRREIGAAFFKQQKYSQGLDELVIRVVNQVASDAGVQIQGVPARRSREANHGRKSIPWAFVLVIAVIIILSVFQGNRRRRKRAFGTWGRGGGWGMSIGSGGFGGGSGASW